MAEVVVIGAGVAGLGAALTLARDGHRVTVLERDAGPLPTGPTDAFESWDRRGTPQARHSHALLARLRNLLRDRFPDVLDDVLEAGATEIRFCDLLPDTIDDHEPREGDEDLVALACRRTTFEWVLRRAVDAEPGARFRDGVTVTGIDLDGAGGGRPAVTGVRIADHATLPADHVVVATGRRSGLPRWLAEHDIELEAAEEDTGIVYLSRFYRLRDGADEPDTTGLIGGDLEYLKYAVFRGDNRTFSVTLAVRSDDRELRAQLLDPGTFARAAGELEIAAPWLDDARSEPITEVHVMGGLVNRLTRFTDDDGEPLVTGLHAVGDSHTCTNPLYGRGCTLGMVQASLLADALSAHPTDTLAAGRTYEASCAREVEPWYHSSVAQDRGSRRAAERDEADTGKPGDEGVVDPELFMRDIVRHGILPAVRTDADVFRAFIRSFNLLIAPEDLMADPYIAGRVFAAYGERDQRPPDAPLGPPRRELLAALTS